MASFKEDDDFRLDFKLLEWGYFTRYSKEEVLNKDLEVLKNELNYYIFDFDCSTWKNGNIIKRQIYSKFDFPKVDSAYSGLHFDAMADWMGDLEYLEYEGTFDKVIVFRHFEQFEEPANIFKFRKNFLELLYESARYHLLFGRHLIILLQIDDEDYKLPEFGNARIELKDRNG